jgi:predicted MFS family arabinose efflux permease
LPGAPPWQPLALSAAVGALLMAAAVVPLAAMPAVENCRSARPRFPWRTLALVVKDRPYRRLLAFSCWFALASGMTLSAQQLYPIRVLQLPYETMLLFGSLMWAGQCLAAPSAGRLIDRYGSSPVMVVSLLIASSGLLFFLAATPQRPWILVGAYIAWIAYAGLNVGLDKTKLHLADPDNNAPYLAAYHALSDLANGAAIIGGGVLYDRLAAGGSGALILYAQLFLAGWLARSSAALLLVHLHDRGGPKGPANPRKMKIE